MQRFIAFASLLAYLPSHGSHTVVTCTRCSYVNYVVLGWGGGVGVMLTFKSISYLVICHLSCVPLQLRKVCYLGLGWGGGGGGGGVV